ncbi:MAG: MBOAT family protein [Candidatus Obscuribacterales bacterium]
MFWIAYLVYWTLLLAVTFRVASNWKPGSGDRRLCFAAAGLLAFYVMAIFGLSGHLEPWQRLFLGSIGLLQTIKTAAVLVSRPQMDLPGVLIYMTVWPGVRAIPKNRRKPDGERLPALEEKYNRGYWTFCSGLLLTVITALAYERLPVWIVGWLGLAALLTTIHFGYAQLLSTSLRLLGFDVEPLFDEPLISASGHDFWSRRWNLAFVQMNQLLLMPLLRGRMPVGMALLVAFVVSGLLHEIGISYAAGAGWGGPLLYFALQGIWFLSEHHLRYHKLHPALLRAAAWIVILLPLPLIFTDAFRAAFIVPLFAWLHAVLTAHDLKWYIATALWCAATGNFCTMLAGVQVPSRMNWKEEFQRLGGFNRKILTNYYCYIGLMIAAWGTLTIVLHSDMMRGERAALWLAGLIAIFWTVRVIVDFLYFKPGDYPHGTDVVVGKALLSTLFILLSLSYWALIAWHALT